METSLRRLEFEGHGTSRGNQHQNLVGGLRTQHPKKNQGLQARCCCERASPSNQRSRDLVYQDKQRDGQAPAHVHGGDRPWVGPQHLVCRWRRKAFCWFAADPRTRSQKGCCRGETGVGRASDPTRLCGRGGKAGRSDERRGSAISSQSPGEVGTPGFGSEDVVVHGRRRRCRFAVEHRRCPVRRACQAGRGCRHYGGVRQKRKTQKGTRRTGLGGSLSNTDGQQSQKKKEKRLVFRRDFVSRPHGRLRRCGRGCRHFGMHRSRRIVQFSAKNSQ
mmetsp:Transcript_11012/g.23342  ORF Transcript_11012/g.23342 Transcript_11012/m.23342 type:complete len:275 (+) Transcript_11012:534-1358(+)